MSYKIYYKKFSFPTNESITTDHDPLRTQNNSATTNAKHKKIGNKKILES